MTEQQLKSVADQQVKFEVIQKMLFNWKNENKKFQKLGIFGPAGVGKSYMAKQVIQYINDEIFPDFKINILACCLSHSANAVLETMLNGLDCDFQVMTLASAQHHRPNITQDGKMNFVYKPKKEKIGRKWVTIPRPLEICNVVVFDECSQRDDKTTQEIELIIDKNCIQIYLGDWCQTAPINLEKGQYISNIFNIPSVILNIPFRYEGDNQRLVNEIRKHINTGLIRLKSLGKDNAFKNFLGKDDYYEDDQFDINCWKKFINDVNDSFHFYENKIKFWNQLRKDFKESTEDPYSCKIIAYNNYMQVNMGKRIRNYINKNEFDYQVDDIIMGMNNYYAYGDSFEIKLKNSEHAIIEQSRFLTKKIAFVKSEYSDHLYFGYVDKDMTEEMMMLMYGDELSKDDEIIFETIQLISIRLKGKNGYLPIAIAPKDKKRWEEILISINSGGYYSKKEWNYKYHAIHDFKSILADIEYAFGITCHKSQGLSIGKVFTHLPNIMNSKYSSDIAKLQCLYVALTRAMEQNHIYYGDD
jgi:hypothetical protein